METKILLDFWELGLIDGVFLVGITLFSIFILDILKIKKWKK